MTSLGNWADFMSDYYFFIISLKSKTKKRENKPDLLFTLGFGRKYTFLIMV